MADVHALPKLRPLGKLEQVSATCHHLGFYNNVGVSSHYKLSGGSVASLRDLIYRALASVVRDHRILSAIPVDEGTPQSYFASLPSVNLDRAVQILEREAPLSDPKESEDKELDALLQSWHNTSFKSEYGTLPFWRLLVLKPPGKQTEFTASFIFHHAIGDGLSGVVFHRAFQVALNTFQGKSFDLPPERYIESNTGSLLPPLEDLHHLPINENPAAPPVNAALKEWTGAQVLPPPCHTNYRSLYVSPHHTKVFSQESKKRGVSITASISSTIGAVLFSILPPDIEAIKCLIPVSLRPWLKLPGDTANDAIGTYIDAFKVQLTRDDLGAESPQTWHVAKKVSQGIHHYVHGNLSPSGEPYTEVAIFRNIPDLSVVFQSLIGSDRAAAYEVSNLGIFSGSRKADAGYTLGSWEVGRVTFSRSTVVSGCAVTMSVVTGGDGGMTIGFSWQQGVVEDDLVERLIRGVATELEAYV
ncbi:unnamed protein product [Clonostachys rhizophaga]|uniref:Alcohol acetyltransferase FCK4 n=1 Tax=Clonostachys rhizophaga TaxID=160324 RepID=A0A9N9V512_9HYPO|nr:unnamed protein product [Clonostachys rhizophaga]